MGMEDYCRALGLSEPDLYSAQGDSMDVDALVVRMEEGLRLWLRDGRLPPHQFPDPATVRARHHRLVQEVRAMDVQGPVMDEPFPNDLLEGIVAASPSAAGTGRIGP